MSHPAKLSRNINVHVTLYKLSGKNKFWCCLIVSRRRAAEKENEIAVDELDDVKEDFYEIRRSLAHSGHLEKAVQAKLASIKQANDNLQKKIDEAEGEPGPAGPQGSPGPEVRCGTCLHQYVHVC
jgi:hypothetical protein